jgi:Glycosyl transferase family 2
LAPGRRRQIAEPVRRGQLPRRDELRRLASSLLTGFTERGHRTRSVRFLDTRVPVKSSLHRLPEREALFPPGSATSVPPGLRRSVTDLDIAIPVYDGERILAASVRRLHSFLSEEFPFSWRIIIADNASTDRTPVIAARLSDELPAVRMLHLEAKGRGRALRAAWSASDARVVCYRDADLSTELNRLLPLVAPAALGSQRSGDRYETGLGRARHTGDQARVHLARLQPPLAPSAAREVQRCPVRVQCAPPRHRG